MILFRQQTAWQQLLEWGSNGSFETIVGLKRYAFNELVHILFSYEELAAASNQKKLGRKRLLTCEDQVGLLMIHVTSSMGQKHLGVMFGVLPATVSTTLSAMIPRCHTKLLKHPAAAIKFPGIEQQCQYAAMITRRQGEVHDVIGFLDGVQLPAQCSEQKEAQSVNYNGYKHDTFSNTVYLFAPTGKIIYAALNYPGSWHDSSVSRKLNNAVIAMNEDFKICVDQGFPRSGLLCGKYVGPLSKRARALLAPNVRSAAIGLHNVYTSLRQASEWGMRAIQGSFPRLKCRLPGDSKKRHDLLLTVTLLYNFRISRYGANQINTVFRDDYEQYINVHGYSNIAMFFDNMDRYDDA